MNESFFRERNMTEVYRTHEGYVAFLNPERAEQLASLDLIKKVILQQELPGTAEPGIFPNEPALYSWNKDNFGPLYIPEKGATVAITPETLPLYKHIILRYEQHENAKLHDGKLYIDGKEISQYTFKQNYYFMMGDNRHNSLDSRYWGFVPEDHVVGKAVFVWLSMDPEGHGLLDKIRWSRLFSLIN
ncbi:signal peptidase I [Pontibacter pamirensis]|uniref:signal peptidase I n=1 Tax=Pontibacter pamirensis TaxID=2562824 RepID=UPI00293BEB49|nr:signal peptidase I [Pontibacter pamirensis]